MTHLPANEAYFRARPLIIAMSAARLAPVRLSEEQWQSRCPVCRQSRALLFLVLDARDLRYHCRFGCSYAQIRSALRHLWIKP